LAAAGARVALVARSREAIDALARDLGDGHAAVDADLAAPGGADAAVAAVTGWAGGAPDILVNNAGSFAPTPLADQDPDEFAAMLRLNLESPFRLVRAFVRPMRARGSGHIVTVGSVADRSARPGNAAYSASKFGLRALHEVIRAELRGTGVRASLVSPGPVDTPIWNPVEGRLGRDFPARDAMLAADDVARAIVFVVSQPAHVDVEELRLSHS
ncbi:MAG: SDR family NAD(P)-dependent oxidoreductase, partial [Gemmatimonadota bacterium]|nr:SDR family NAD(P)-dependent oxidoreductase [Gemmatimonadota bacterium]